MSARFLGFPSDSTGYKAPSMPVNLPFDPPSLSLDRASGARGSVSYTLIFPKRQNGPLKSLDFL
jgi:hypothetical protein